MAAVKKVRSKNRRMGIPVEEDMLSQMVQQLVSQTNRNAKIKLDNRADLTSLVPVFFFALGLVELFRNPQMPKWNECWWYSYSIFKDFNYKK